MSFSLVRTEALKPGQSIRLILKSLDDCYSPYLLGTKQITFINIMNVKPRIVVFVEIGKLYIGIVFTFYF